MSTVASSETFEMAPYVEKASRLELLVRLFYAIIISVVYGLWGIFVGIIQFLLFFHILILGRKGARLYRYSRQYLAAYTYVNAYLMFLTDQRPELTPDLMVFFKNVRAYSPTGQGLSSQSPGATGNKHCISCGAAIVSTAKFCGSCGASQT